MVLTLTVKMTRCKMTAEEKSGFKTEEGCGLNTVCDAGEEFHAGVAGDKSTSSSVSSSNFSLLFFFSNLRANLQFTLHCVFSTGVDCFAHVHPPIEQTGLTDLQRQNTLLTEHPVLGFI